LTQQSSRFTARHKAQKGDSVSGYRQIERRLDICPAGDWNNRREGTKILALTDALGNLVRFVLLPGNRYDTIEVDPLISGLSFDALLADKAFDANWIIEEMNDRGAVICISQRPQRKEPLEIDPIMYGRRHLVENSFCNLKDFRRIALRSDKTDTSFSAMIHACAVLLNSR